MRHASKEEAGESTVAPLADNDCVDLALPSKLDDRLGWIPGARFEADTGELMFFGSIAGLAEKLRRKRGEQLVQ